MDDPTRLVLTDSSCKSTTVADGLSSSWNLVGVGQGAVFRNLAKSSNIYSCPINRILVELGLQHIEVASRVLCFPTLTNTRPKISRLPSILVMDQNWKDVWYVTKSATECSKCCMQVLLVPWRQVCIEGTDPEIAKDCFLSIERKMKKEHRQVLY